MCNADSGVRRDGPANKSSIFPRLAPSSASPRAKTGGHISTFVISGVKSCVQRVLVGICCLDLCWPLCFCWFQTKNKDQERTVELIFFVEIHNRKLPDLQDVFHGISYEFYYSVFSIFPCHSNVFVDLHANFINKKSLMSICMSSLNLLSSVPSAYAGYIVFKQLRCLRAAQKPRPYPLVSGWNANNTVEWPV